jgi:predicted ATP-grasp superfamily ATP-dependent carboligase
MLTNADYLLAVITYGLFRDPKPTQELVDKVIKKMEHLNIDVSHLVRSPADHCVDLQPPTTGGTSA